MTFMIKVGSLFDVPADYVLAHCISADFAMGAGIAVAFADMGVKQLLLRNYPANQWNGEGLCLPVKLDKRVICNLVTKQLYWQKPTYNTLYCSLMSMRNWLLDYAKTSGKSIKVAMPEIGCGLDRLEWKRVQGIIKDVFKDTDFEILICKLDNQ